MPLLSPINGRLRREEGFLLIEVMVSAVLLIMVSLAVFTMLDQSDRLAGNNQKRAIAANMGQTEIERVRALPIEDIARLNGTRTVNEAGTEYQVTTVGKWVTDGTDEPDCTTRSGGLDYMRLSVSVSWTGAESAKPFRISTIVTPVVRSNSTTGSLSVYVRGEPVGAGPTPKIDGLTIRLSGTASFEQTTNPNGCVVFPFIPVGPYKLEFSKGGYVTRNHVNDVEENISVTGGQTTKLEYEYDQGGTTNTTFVTGVDGGTRPTRPNVFSIVNGANETVIPLMGATSWDGALKPLYPAAAPYQLYAGACSLNVVPASGLVGLPSDAIAPTYVQIPKAGFQGSPPVRLPAYNVVVYRGTTTASPRVAGARVNFMAGCGASYVRSTNSDGELDDPGFPYTNGTGTLCVSGPGASNAGGTGGTSARRHTATSVTNNTFHDSPPVRNVFLGSAPTGSACAAS